MQREIGSDALTTELASGRAVFSCLLLLWTCLTFTSAHAKKKPPTMPLDLNTATAEQLEQLPGIGPAAAQAIVNFRMKSGRFQKVEDLLAIRGISQRKLDQLRPYVTVRAVAAKPPAAKNSP